MRFLLSRVVLTALSFAAVALVIFGGARLLRPDLYPAQTWLAGVLDDFRRGAFHFDFGRACGQPGCPEVAELFKRGAWVDLWLIAGGMLLGVLSGLRVGVWCAHNPRSVLVRAVTFLATLFYCCPVYLVGLALLVLFNPIFGAVPLPLFFESHVYVSPFENPWEWFRSLILPWFVVAAPIWGGILRLTLALVNDEKHQDYVLTARAKGLAERIVLRRHAGAKAYFTVASLSVTTLPLVITNVVLVEYVFSVPGFFELSRAAFVNDDIPLMQGLALWAGLLILVFSVLGEQWQRILDPRLRASG